jgi:ATP-dependent Zn proteases
MWLPEEDKYTNRKNELLASLAVSMGGRVAEEIILATSPTARAATSGAPRPLRVVWFANGA